MYCEALPCPCAAAGRSIRISAGAAGSGVTALPDPRCTPGATNFPKNLWPRPNDPGATGFHRNSKDKRENALKRQVRNGTLPLATAQQAIARNWVTAARRYG